MYKAAGLNPSRIKSHNWTNTEDFQNLLRENLIAGQFGQGTFFILLKEWNSSEFISILSERMADFQWLFFVI